MPQRISGIYVIENTLNGHLYVGSSSNIEKRWKNHLYELKRGSHHSPYLQNAYSKYGIDTFTFKVIEEVFPDATLLCQREQHWVDTLQPQYNVCPVAGSQLGLVHSPERRAKQAKSIKAAWDRKTEEERQVFSEKASQRRHSAETKRKQADRKRGVKQTDEQIHNRAQGMIGHEVRQATRQKLSESNKAAWAALTEEERQARIETIQSGRVPISEETRQKQSEAKLGMKWSDESLAKRSATNTGRKRSEETRARMQIVNKAAAQRRKAEKLQQLNVNQDPLF